MSAVPVRSKPPQGNPPNNQPTSRNVPAKAPAAHLLQCLRGTLNAAVLAASTGLHSALQGIIGKAEASPVSGVQHAMGFDRKSTCSTSACYQGCWDKSRYKYTCSLDQALQYIPLLIQPGFTPRAYFAFGQGQVLAPTLPQGRRHILPHLFSPSHQPQSYPQGIYPSASPVKQPPNTVFSNTCCTSLRA